MRRSKKSSESEEDSTESVDANPQPPALTMSKTLHEDYSLDEGPRCPNPECHRQYTADEPRYFDESGYPEECDECGMEFFVQPIISTSWRTTEFTA